MNVSALSTNHIIQIIIGVMVVVAGFVGMGILRKRRTKRLRTQFGDTEYSRALAEGGSRRKGEAGLKEREERVDSLNIRPLSPRDRARFAELWLRTQGRFVGGPGGAVAEADRLLRDLMSTRGYPITGFEQRAADVSVGHPLVIENFRRAHEIAFRQTRGHASNDDLRQAMFHYRALFKEFAGEPELVNTSTTSA